MLTDADIEKLAELIRERPPVNKCICQSAAHESAHTVLDRWIENDVRRNRRNEKIKASVIGGLLLGLVGSIGTGAVTAISYLKEHLK